MKAKIIISLISIIVLALYLSACSGSGGSSPGQASASGYTLYVPANFKAHESALVIALHPKHANGLYMQNLTQLNAKADQVGFAVAYPSAAGSAFEQVSWKWFFTDEQHIQSLRTMINSLQNTLKPDPKKIYAMGYSDGAIMTHRVGVQLSDLVAAIGVVGGSLYENDSSSPSVPDIPATVAPISVLILHGDLDAENNVGYCGRQNIFPTQDVVINYWVGSSGNNCATFDTTAPLCNGSTPTDTVAKNATNCTGGTEVQFYRLIGGRHEWHNVSGHWSMPMNNPRVAPNNPNFNDNTGITTNDILWNFFAAHPKP
jgi:polyhydroxybutyrate depolymerase